MTASRASLDDSDPRPLLVTGCYRSGTTVLEKSLHMHPAVVVASQPIFNDTGAAEALRDECQVAGDYVYDSGTFYAPAAAEKRFEAREYLYRGRDAYQAIINEFGNP